MPSTLSGPPTDRRNSHEDTLISCRNDEHLTLKVSQEKAHSGRGLEWTYYVLAKQDVVECRQGGIDAEELRLRAYVYSRRHPSR